MREIFMFRHDVEKICNELQLLLISQSIHLPTFANHDEFKDKGYKDAKYLRYVTTYQKALELFKLQSGQTFENILAENKEADNANLIIELKNNLQEAIDKTINNVKGLLLLTKKEDPEEDSREVYLHYLAIRKCHDELNRVIDHYQHKLDGIDLHQAESSSVESTLDEVDSEDEKEQKKKNKGKEKIYDYDENDIEAQSVTDDDFSDDDTIPLLLMGKSRDKKSHSEKNPTVPSASSDELSLYDEINACIEMMEKKIHRRQLKKNATRVGCASLSLSMLVILMGSLVTTAFFGPRTINYFRYTLSNGRFESLDKLLDQKSSGSDEYCLNSILSHNKQLGDGFYNGCYDIDSLNIPDQICQGLFEEYCKYVNNDSIIPFFITLASAVVFLGVLCGGILQYSQIKNSIFSSSLPNLHYTPEEWHRIKEICRVLNIDWQTSTIGQFINHLREAKQNRDGVVAFLSGADERNRNDENCHLYRFFQRDTNRDMSERIIRYALDPKGPRSGGV